MQRLLPVLPVLALSFLVACGGGGGEDGTSTGFARVTGFVRDSGEDPVAFVEVTAFPPGATVDALTVPTQAAFSNGGGIYELLLASPGGYDIYVRRQGVAQRTLVDSIPVPAAGDTLFLDLTIP